MTSHDEKQEQILSNVRKEPVAIEELRLSLTASFLSKNVKIIGIAVLPNQMIVILDNKFDRLLLVNEDGTKQKRIPGSNDLYDLTVVDNTTVAASTTVGVSVISIETKKSTKQLISVCVMDLSINKGPSFAVFLAKEYYL